MCTFIALCFTITLENNKLIFDVYGSNKYFKIYRKYNVYILKKSNRLIYGMNWTEDFQKCVQNRKKKDLWIEIHSEILLKLKRKDATGCLWPS